jgi:hypothetical protein
MFFRKHNAVWVKLKKLKVQDSSSCSIFYQIEDSQKCSSEEKWKEWKDILKNVIL